MEIFINDYKTFRFCRLVYGLERRMLFVNNEKLFVNYICVLEDLSNLEYITIFFFFYSVQMM